MNKIIIEVETITGDVYEIRSTLMSRSLFSYMSQTQLKTPQDETDLYKTILLKTGAEWKLSTGMTWNKDNWEALPPMIVTSWLKQLVISSGSAVEAKVRTEKK